MAQKPSPTNDACGAPDDRSSARGDLFAEAGERDADARALATLTHRRRQAAVLTELLGYGSEEAAEARGVSR